MAGFKLDRFTGLRPRISPVKLQHGEAQIAQNVDTGTGDLDPWQDKQYVQSVTIGRTSRTIYLFENNGDPKWLEWDDAVDVARGPVKGDILERTYYTGDSTGTGAPKMTNTALVGTVAPYPAAFVYIGVPAPTEAVTVTVPQMPEDVTQANRVVQHRSIKTDTLLIDNVNFNVFPGTGTPNGIWRWAATAEGKIEFDVQKGSSFRVTEVINFNKVKLESASEPGIFARTLNSDKSTITDWKLLDEQGSTQTADAVGWRVPVGATVTIVGHRLAVGDVITASALAIPLTWGTHLADDLYEQTWTEPELIEIAGTSFYNVGNAAISSGATLGDVKFIISGSFYYDVDRAASTVSELEARTYVYTYVTNYGEEGPPSPVSESYDILDGVEVLLEGLALPPTIGYNITHMRIYRTASSEAGTEYQFVKEIELSTTVYDAVPNRELAEILGTTSWDPPDPEMTGLIAMPNGMMAGFKGKTVFFCEPYFPHAWPPEYDQAIDHEIVGLAAIGNAVAVMTKGWPYILSGAHPRNASLRPIKVNQACVNKASIASDGDLVYYASPDGLVEISANGVRVATEDYLRKEDWQAYSPDTMVGSFHEGRYYGFYDFDASLISPFISAEVGGTIRQTDENVVALVGGLTITLTVTNDTWLAAGASFDAERQAIIDGLTAATNQVLGWNNKIRDEALVVTDVVRTSDHVVTITVPAVSGYAISFDEIIQPVIPASALTTTSTDLPTASTFRIFAVLPEATVSIDGTLAGDYEADVVTGGQTITLTLSSDTWVPDGTEFDAQRQALINGIQATTDETDGWNDLAIQLIPLSSVVRTADSVVTITLPAIPDYNITSNESLISFVPHTALVLTDVELGSINSIAILANTGLPAALFSGTVQSATENQIIAGGRTIIITLFNDTWEPAGTGPIGSAAVSSAIVDAILATTSQTLGWNNVVNPGIENADLVRTSDTVATITLDAEATYTIETPETIGMNIPHTALQTSTSDLAVANTFGIIAQKPVICTVSGTATATISELDIVAGGKTIILTLQNDTWVAAGATFNAERAAIIAGLSAASSPADGWNAVLRDAGIDVADVVRTNSTKVTITLDAEATYNIAAKETITVTVPASALVIAESAIVASPTFTVDFISPITVAMSGTLNGSGSRDIFDGGKTIILTVTADTWVAVGATFDAQRAAIIAGLSAASSPADGWNEEVRDGTLVVGNVVRTSNTKVTITLQATTLYDRNTTEIITATVPASALTISDIAVVASSPATITPFSTATSRLMYSHKTGGMSILQHLRKIEVSYYDIKYWTTIFNPIGGEFGEIIDDAAYSVAEGLWLATGSDANPGTYYTSADYGLTWTARTVANAGDVGKVAQMFRSDHHDLWLAAWEDNDTGHDNHWEYSADAISWIDISAAVIANAPVLTGTDKYEAVWNGSVDSSAVNSPRPVFWYGGVNHVYALLNDDGNNYQNQLVRSANLSTGAITDNWGVPATTTYTGTSMSSRLKAIGSGNGIILALTIDTSDSNRKKLEYITHGNSTFVAGTNRMASMTVAPFAIVFGNDTWVMMNAKGDVWYVDVNGGAVNEKNANNWTKIASIDVLVGPSDHNGFHTLFYDTQHGFIALALTGIGPAEQSLVYQSADGITWTHPKAFTITRDFEGDIWAGTPTDGTDLD
jgi:hypothetical protein